MPLSVKALRSVCLALFCVATLAILPASPLRAEEASSGLSACSQGQGLAPSGPYAKLARGVNLPNWEPSHTGLKPDAALLGLLLKEGFTHIRLPVDGEWLMAEYTKPEDTELYLSTLEAEVLRLHGLGFAVTVDMHPAGRFQALHRIAPDAAFTLLIEAWDLIVSRSKSWPQTDIYFELLNEPVPQQDVWWAQAQTLVTHLNQVTPNRYLIVGPAVFQRYEPLLSSQPLKGEGLIYVIHYYDPFIFTHQAMNWDPNTYLSDVGHLPFPADAEDPLIVEMVKKFRVKGNEEAAADIEKTYANRWDAARILSDLTPVGDWSRTHQVPVIINEFGVLNFDVDMWARHDWLQAVRRAAEQNCLGWAHWDFSDGFALIDNATTLPDPFVLDALVGKP